MAIMNNITTSTDDGSLGPESYTLHQNYPNPFNPVTTISYDIPEDALVNVTIYNMGGEVVKTLINQTQTSGYKSIQWNATNTVGQAVSAGLYLYRIHAGDFIMSKKMVLLK
jgi:flagellar hook assembly protein FlgD